jgi:hypothetical protein
MQAIDEQRSGDDTDTGRDLYPYEPVDYRDAPPVEVTWRVPGRPMQQA